MKLKRSSRAEAQRQLVDAVIDGYVTWREQTLALDGAYRRWKHASRPDQTAAFDEYVFALDREEEAASAYRLLVEQAGALTRGR
ncbi:MAG TPA: hypothetical protein VMP89_05425 [Solirubrobacteraceae bacterium]|nr:hypothetical protein [Solirubrobacteraceae bacterium]